MTLVDDNRTGGFAMTWSIHNFSYCVQKEGEYIDSPHFKVEFVGGDTTWYLRLYPRGYSASGFVSYYLMRKGNATTLNCVLSIRVSNGLFKEIREQTLDLNSSTSKGYKQFLKLSELKGSDAYLENDTLTLRCRMWKEDTDFTESVNYFSHTTIKVSKLDYVWTLNDIRDYNEDNHAIDYKFTQSTKIQCFYPIIPCLKIHLLYGRTFGEDTIHFGIEKEEGTKKWFLNCLIHLLDADGREAYAIQSEHLFESSDETQIWTFPFISKSKLLSKEDTYLANGSLILRCELSASTGDVNSETDRFQYKRTHDCQIKSSFQRQVQDQPEPWKENMLRFYNEQKFCDVTFRTPSSKFHAHKAILCAQSEVFSAMIERDMKKHHEVVIKINDLEDEIVSKMLLFLYTNTLEDIDFFMTRQLYFAAYKYRIKALYRKCSSYLGHNLDTSNVCDVLVVADSYKDEKLKSTAQDFIIVHDYEIMSSEEWKELMISNAELTSETMQMRNRKKLIDDLKP